MNRHAVPQWIGRGALFACCLLGRQALATNFEICVQSDADLASAIDQARSIPVTAKIVQHKLTAQNQAYDLKNTLWSTGFPGVQSGTQFLGGYTAGCTSRDIAARNTLIVDSRASPFDAFQPRGNLTVEGLTFSVRNGINLGLGSGSYLKVASGSTILFRRDAFLNAIDNALVVDWDQAADSDSTIRVVDSLFANNTGLDFSCGLYLEADSGAPEIDVINNTIVDNAGNNAFGACFYGTTSNAELYAYNNIFYGTTGTSALDLHTDTTQVVLVDNIFAARSGPTPIVTQDNRGGDPNLDANYVPMVPSPAINSGENTVPGSLPASDLDGGPRIVGSIVDRGAYETTIDPSPTQIVTKTADDGTSGTLRNAFNSVIANHGGTIKFSMASGSCPWVITLGSELNLTSTSALNATIDGYSQTGASKNDLQTAIGDDAILCIVLEAASGPGGPGRGVVVPSDAKDGTSLTIEGIGFSGFSTTAIDLQGGSEHSLVGNHFGGNVSGHTLAANGYDIRLGAATHDNTIGSESYADRNIIGGATNSRIVVVSGSTGNEIVDNYIGLGWNTAGSGSYTNRGNGARGIYLAGDSNTISFNVIGFNAQAGIVLDGLGAHNNVVSNNYIGADIEGTNVGNLGAGIHLIGDGSGTGDAPNNNSIRFNTIADNGAQGVLIDVGQGNRVRKNSIYGNAALGLDLDAVGVTGNNDDSLPQPTDEANLDRNFPVLSSAGGGYQNGTVSGTLPTLHGDYTVDFYDSPACGNRDSQSWVGSVSVTVPGSGEGTASMINVPIAAALFGQLLDGSKITATATDANGNTSEFSACQNYVNDTLFTDGFDGLPPTG